MTYFLRLLPLLAGLATAAEPDMLRLTDGSLEGRYAGITPAGMLQWDREDAGSTLEFRLDKVRHIALRGARPATPTGDRSHVFLTNGDCLPGVIRRMDADQLALDTPFAGTLTVPARHLTSLAPNPFGGRLIYAGPFSAEGWETINPQTDDPERLEEADGDDSSPTWQHTGGYWYYSGGPEALRLPLETPRQSVLRFHLDWRNRPPFSVAFMADFASPPAPAPDDEEPRSRPDLPTTAFGNCLVLTLRGSYATLQRCGFDEEGKPFSRMIRSAASTVEFGHSDRADFEIRTDLDRRTVTLFVDGSYMLRWNLDDQPEEPTSGGGIGFMVPGSREALRISNILVAEWNGMPDAARSLRHPERDLVLLTNGTDRFSGEVKSIADGHLEFESAYAQLSIPLEEIAEVHFADRPIEAVEEDSADRVRALFQPIGSISGKVSQSDATHLQIASPLLGPVRIDLSPVSLLEFRQGGEFLSPWDEDL